MKKNDEKRICLQDKQIKLTKNKTIEKKNKFSQ